MSVRAYKVIKKDVKKSPTFNLWHCNQDILHLLNLEEQASEMGFGSICISRDDVEEALKRIEDGEIEDKDALKEDLERILADFGEDEQDIEYECY